MLTGPVDVGRGAKVLGATPDAVGGGFALAAGGAMVIGAADGKLGCDCDVGWEGSWTTGGVKADGAAEDIGGAIAGGW
jgi:hypothetical protein